MLKIYMRLFWGDILKPQSPIWIIKVQAILRSKNYGFGLLL